MNSRKLKVCTLLTAMLAVSVTGCFGDNILSAGAKVAGGQISSLTAGEIQILSQTVNDILASENPGFEPVELTETQAQALTDFFSANELNTFEDFETLSQTAQSDPDSIQGLDELAEAFADAGSDLDPDNLDPNDLDEILQSIFGGLGVGGGTGGGGVDNGGDTGQQQQQS
ncbi:MAG: hypothetical protein MI923_06195 [Phycisphaerales bacterium]|nr:hypothetical protein [Phycisphaerales bacterium]